MYLKTMVIFIFYKYMYYYMKSGPEKRLTLGVLPNVSTEVDWTKVLHSTRETESREY
jgi:hypothetical protein